MSKELTQAVAGKRVAWIMMIIALFLVILSVRTGFYHVPDAKAVASTDNGQDCTMIGGLDNNQIQTVFQGSYAVMDGQKVCLIHNWGR